MKTPSRRRSTSRFNYLLLFGVLLFAVVGLALPAVYSSSPAEPSAGNNVSSRVPGYTNWLPSIAPAALAGETIEVFAADCTTPRTAFAAGETICAKTNGVDLTIPGNYYVNWFHPNTSETNGGTITANPQYTLYSIPTSGSYLGTWKANIGRVSPAEGSIIGSPALFTVSTEQTIATFAYSLGACTNTPKTNFVVGDTVCARTAGVDPQFNRRFAWVDADGVTREFTPITSDPATDDYVILPTETSIGTWKANVVSSRGSTVVGTPFTVAALTPSVDLSIGKGLNSEVKSGDPVTFQISVYSRGPSDAQNVVITDVTPANATFVSATQVVGSGFTCTGTSTVTCTGAILKPGERAVFDFVYTAGAAGQTITNTATVDSDTAEVVAGEDTDNDTIDDASEDNSSTAGPHVISPGSGSGGSCTVACPDDIETPANTNQAGQDGAIVHFSQPSGTEGCGTISVDHCNDCFFPQGDTVVTATDSTSGETCSFTVKVTAPGTGTTVSCPANKTADADASVCSTSVIVGTATATGTNVTVVGYRSDGLAMYNCDPFGNCTRKSSDAPFSSGTTTITWYAYSHDVAGPYGPGPLDASGNPINDADTEEGHRTGSATCTQTVIVKDVTPPVIGATNSSASANASCEAPVPDYSSTVTDNCACGSADDSEDCEGHPHIVYTQTPAAGTMVGLGPHTVHIEATDGSEFNNGSTKDVTFTVNDTTAPVINCPANIPTTTDPGVCSAVVNPGTATATDNCDTTPTITASRSDSQALNAPYPKGVTTITWRATDDSGNYSECSQTITVVDNQPPTFTFTAMQSMWPPNHKYQTFTTANLVASVQDNCDSIPVSSVVITKVTSDEIENGNGDGNTMNDIVIAANCKSVQLRSEREGNGNGRVYTIFFSVTDSSGNTGVGYTKVVVQHNPGETAVDSGPHYTVMSNCP